MIYARQSTAIIVTVGPVLDADGVAVTNCVVADFKLSKNGGAPAALDGSATLTHRFTGHYSLSLTATDVNTVGTAEAVIDDTVNACPMKEIQVVEPATYDVLFADAAPGPASPTNITAGTVTTATNVTTVNGLAANVITAASVANGAIDAATFAADVDAEILSYIVDDATRIDASSLNTAAVTTIPAILADTGTDGVVVAAGSKTGYTLSAGGLADFFDTDTGTTYASAVAGSVVKEIADNAGGSALTAAAIADAVWDEAVGDHQGVGSTGEALSDAGGAGTPPTAAEVADAVWDEAQAGHVGAGSFGEIATEIASVLVDTAEIGAAGAGLTAINLPDQTMNITGDITGSLSGSVGSVTGAVGSVTAAVTVDDSTPIDVNVEQINTVPIVGDGSGTPFNV